MIDKSSYTISDKIVLEYIFIGEYIKEFQDKFPPLPHNQWRLFSWYTEDWKIPENWTNLCISYGIPHHIYSVSKGAKIFSIFSLPKDLCLIVGHLSSFDIGNTSFDEGCTIGLSMH